MMARRIESGVERGAPIRIDVNGEAMQAYAGETVAATLLAANVTSFHHSKRGSPRGPFCNMGTCFECLVRVGHVDEPPAQSWVRACMTIVEEDMTIATGVKFANRVLGAEDGVRSASPSAAAEGDAENGSLRERGGE